MASEHYTTNYIEFRGRPTDESVYVYPHRYRIELRRTHQGWEQRHIWYWDQGGVRTDDWIPSLDHSKPGRLDGFTRIADAA